MKTVAICQARMGSTRLPGKVLKNISGDPTLAWVTECALRAPGVDQVIVATSTLPGDDAIAGWSEQAGLTCFRGSETDVLSRFLGAAIETDADVIVRLTGDCPFLDPSVIGEVIQLRKIRDCAYATNTDPPTYPDGLDVEVFTRAVLESAHREATRGTDRDTVTRFMVRNRHRLSSANLVCPLPDLVRERWVLDSPEDYEFCCELAKYLNGPGSSYVEILQALDKAPEIRAINSKYTRNERFYDVLHSESEKAPRSYSVSKACLARAEHLIPLGAQTFSKSKLQFPEGVSPLFVTHGDGGYVFDVDGNDFVDLVGGLLPNILGYRDPDVDQAIRRQLDQGISFSLATTLEADLAERLNHHIPSAEMVRFGKNGSDVTTAAVRLARHITGRKDVLVGGYHGWHDWSMGVNTERNMGIPLEVSYLSIKPEANGNVDGPPKRYAAWIIEPEFYTEAQLKYMRKTTDEFGIILIFDEIISGFRCGMGGLQKVTGVTPDLSTFGKAMANGMPISALVGKEQFMKRMPEISYSGTFFGETLSIAAAIATIDKLERLEVPKHLRAMGTVLHAEIKGMLSYYTNSSIELYGCYELNRIRFADKIIQSLFIQEMAKNGVLIIGSHNTCFAHKKPETDRILSAWDKTLRAIAAGGKLDGGIVRGDAVR